MKRGDAKHLAELRIEQHLTGWSFAFDNAKRRFGACYYEKRLITLSKHLVELNDAADVEDTILHEIAHALAGKDAGHGAAWKRVAAHVGATARRCCVATVKTPPPQWTGTCPACGYGYERMRLRRGASCGRCARGYADQFRLVWRRREV